MDNNKSPNLFGGGLNFVEALTIVFIVLRLCNVISWPLWLIISPIWIDLVVGFIAVFVIAVVKAVSDSHSKNK